LEVIITIFKDQFEANPQLQSQLASLSLEVKEITTAILYIPREDSLIDFVSLLDEFRISFGAHAHGDEILRIMGKNRSGMRGNKG
jgi:hypothetical protein